MTWTSPTRAWDRLAPREQQQRRTLWAAGRLKYKLDPTQRRIYDAFYGSHGKYEASADRWFYTDAGRQVGKDFFGTTVAVEACFQQRRPIRIPYVAPTREEVKELLVPTIEKFFLDCPPEFLPREIKDGSFTKSANRLTFSWGAQIIMVGMDLHPGRLRGPSTFAFVFTEPGFMARFSHTVKTVCVPQLITEPDGWWLIQTTPPETPAHDIDKEWLPAAKSRGTHIHLTIEDNPRITRAQVEAQVMTIAGLHDVPKTPENIAKARMNTKVRRELYAEHVVEESLAVVPEWPRIGDPDRDLVVREFERPEHFDGYVALDPGVIHHCAAVFGFYRFDDDALYIEGDISKPGLNTWQTALRLWAREWQLWGVKPDKPKRIDEELWQFALEGDNAEECIRPHFYPDLPIPSAPPMRWNGRKLLPQPYLRVSDTDLRMIADLSKDYGLAFSATAKDDLQAKINNMRTRVQRRKVVVHPRCVNFIANFDQGIWAPGRKKFAESGENGHFDVLAAAVYLDRNVQRGRNPEPPEHFGLDPRTHFIPPQPPGASKAGQALNTILGQRGTVRTHGKRRTKR